MARNTSIRKGWILLLLGLFMGCSSLSTSRVPGNPDPLIKGELTEDKAIRALQMKLAKQMEFHQENAERYRKEVVEIPSGNTIYYYKYYDEFPEGPEGANISISPTEELASSYRGEAKYRKVRYQTRYTRSRGKAAEDDDFIRDEGIQNDTFEFDGEKWQLKDSIFEVIKTSIYREDQWTVSRGRLRRMEEEKPELFVDKVRTLFGLLD